jgi:selenoprotein W-related protein
MAQAIFDEFTHRFRVDLIPSSGGVYEVDVDGERIFSKKQLGRHADYETDIAPHLRR